MSNHSDTANEGGTMMKYRLLGNSGLRVSEAALGTMTFGDDWGWGSHKGRSPAAPGITPNWRLDLVNLGAVVREKKRAVRAGESMREVQNLNP
jgi:hypothetical protein